MQIHELNTFSGTLGSGTYLAIDNGSDTSKISSDNLMIPLSADVLTNISNSEARSALSFPLINGSYYSSTNGSIQTSSSLSRTKMYPAGNLHGLMFKSSATVRVQAIFFNASKTLISYSAVFNSAYSTQKLIAVPDTTVYIAFNVWDGSMSNLSLQIVDGSKVVSAEAPYNGANYIYAAGKWMNASGNIEAVNTLDMICVPNPSASKVFINSASTYNAICENSSGVVISSGTTYTEIAPFGRLYDIPSGTTAIFFNITKSHTDGLGNCSDYISFIRDGEGIAGKKIACIGDSITWLDGQANYGDATVVVGYEAVLRKRGADVRNFGWSGYPYADLTSENVNYGIHKQIVTAGVDLTGFDIAVLFGGANDLLYSSPLGSASEDYSSPNTTGTTFNGAIGGIINYIRTNNPTCKIYLCTMLPSEATTRSYSRNKTYRDAVIQNGDFWQVPVIDMYTLMNTHPTSTSFDSFFYDVTHPNARGMARIGEIIANYIETH